MLKSGRDSRSAGLSCPDRSIGGRAKRGKIALGRRRFAAWPLDARAAAIGDFSNPIFQFDYTLMVPAASSIAKVADRPSSPEHACWTIAMKSRSAAVLCYPGERRYWAVKRREFITLLGGAAAAWPLAAGAQQPMKLRTIGLLGATTAPAQKKWTDAFVGRLRELDWIEGRSIAIEYRWAEERTERVSDVLGCAS
jgi:hypothetical protein